MLFVTHQNIHYLFHPKKYYLHNISYTISFCTEYQLLIYKMTLNNLFKMVDYPSL